MKKSDGVEQSHKDDRYQYADEGCKQLIVSAHHRYNECTESSQTLI